MVQSNYPQTSSTAKNTEIHIVTIKKENCSIDTGVIKCANFLQIKLC